MSFQKKYFSRLLATLIASAFVLLNARASVTFLLGADTLRTAGGVAMPTTGMVILVASTTNSTFEGPTATSFVSGDDIELGRFDLSSTATPGQINTLFITNMSGAWGTGDPLAMYWYPTLTTNATAPGASTSYGFYRDPVANGTYGSGADGSDPWYTPGDGSTIGLYFLTPNGGGSVNTEASGNASLTVPSANNLPIANDDIYQRTSGIPLKITIANLLTNDTDADHDPITFTGFSATTTNGITLYTNNLSEILYTNAANVADKFTYTITDGHAGVSVTGSVYIQIVSVTGTNSVLQLQTGVPGTGSNTIRFAGIPNFQYVSQYATNVTGPWFSFSTNTAASTNGQWTVIDRTATNASRFYRSFY